MSAFSFINESRLPDNQTSNTDALVENSSKRKQKRAAYQQSGQASNSLFIFRDAHDDPFSDHSSHNSAASSSNREENVWNKNFKSSFSFINQGDSTKLTSPVAKHQPLKFSSSFIMEDFMDIDEDRVSVKFDKSMKENVSKYFSFLEEYSSASSGKRRDESRKGKGKTTQSMLDYSVPSDQADGQAPLIKSAFNFINQAPLTTDTSNATSPSLLGEENVHAMSKSIIKPDKETTLLQASTRWQKIQKKKSTQVQRIKKQYEDQIKYQKMVHEMKNEISAIAHEKQQALDSENYEAAHKYAVQGEKMEKDYADLLSRNFQDRIRKEWEQLICILQQESQDAETMARCCQEVKDERRRRFETFAADKERSHKEIVKQMEQQRAAIESEKSEIAFDLDMWSQNHTDLDERMEEAVQAEVKRKKSLEATSATIQLNIDELKQRLSQLESEQLTVNKDLQDVEAVIKDKLAAFKEEVDEDSTEKKTIEARQEEIQQKLSSLDEQDAKIERDVQDQKATQHLNEKELEHLLAQMTQASKRAQYSKTEQGVLQDLLNSIIEKRDQTVAQHNAAIRRSRESIARKSREIKSIQDELYQCEQACIDMEENTTKITIKLKNLDKLKKLAIDNGQFERAGALSLKIKAAQSSLVKLEESKDHQNDISLLDDRLAVAKNELTMLEQELVTLKDEQTTSLRSILEQLGKRLNETLRDETLRKYDTLITFAKCELESINAPVFD